ncbi:hypothetical protein [Microbulbifer guangxiensis]|uniref:hypothetical protein n=1 Tax=Microbulbifer guangxiensis TaxID=2904249 RepID=UPI001F33A9DE|nr:hypothetical protein [Microbulbifer guangxiensis]
MLRILIPILALCLFLSLLAARTSASEAESPASRAAGELALRIVSDYVGVPQEQLRLQSVEAVRWEDSSLGCPKPGRRYLPSVINGHRAVVAYGARDYAVHMANGSGVVCDGVLREGP